MLVCKHVVSRQETHTEHKRSHMSAGNAGTPWQGTRGHQKAKSTRGPRTMTRSMTTATRTATSLAIIREMTLLFASRVAWGPQFLRSEPNTNSRHLFKKGLQARAESNITHHSMDPSARLEPPTNVLSAHMKSPPFLKQPELSSSQENATHVHEIQTLSGRKQSGTARARKYSGTKTGLAMPIHPGLALIVHEINMVMCF